MPLESIFSSVKGDSAFEQVELLPGCFLFFFLPMIIHGLWEGLSLYFQRRLGSEAQMLPSHSWKLIFKDEAFFEWPNEVTRFTTRFESLEADHLSACVVMGMEHLWYDALSYFLPVFQQKLLRCWSLLSVWPHAFALGFYSIAWYQKILKKIVHIDPSLW